MCCVAYEDDLCDLVLPYSHELVGDPDTGVIHGGAITALLDNAAGFLARPADADRQETTIATLDMRIDYMKAATPERDIVARATLVRRTRNISFVRATAFHEDIDDPIATCTATFMLGTPNVPRSAAGAS
ncbi:MAG: PaaI family thioesterase [Actinomycetia bacterium]|nr:PaaI family thioesterase [Actinomycetes bacterium]MCP4960546.1 PaaI family thioesterase [Actinomycetes bacterium]